MGIRYYAYAFDSELTERALADPRSMVGVDPLADAWGLEPGFTDGVTDFQQSLPERIMLYLDKAWRQLQWLTAPSDLDEPPRPAYRMFEGSVHQIPGSYEHLSWVRAIAPQDVAPIADDLETLSDENIEARLAALAWRASDREQEVAYVTEYFQRAKTFVRGLAQDGRGFAYLIG